MAPEFSDGTGEGRGNGAAAATDIWEPAEDGDGEGGEGDGDGVADDYDPLIHDDPENPAYRPPAGDDAPVPRQTKLPRTGAPGFGPADVAAAVTAALKAGQQPGQLPAPVAFDKSAFLKTVGFRGVQETDLASILDAEKPLAERAALLQGILEQNMMSSTTVAQALYTQLQSQFGGIQESIAEQQRQKLEGELHKETIKAYPGLQQYATLLPKLFAEMRTNDPRRPKSPDEAIRMFASYAQRAIRDYNPQFSLRSAQPSQSRQLATSVNTGGGQGAPQRGGGKRPAWASIWDKPKSN